MKNYLIVTPFFPHPIFDWMKKDSNVVYYLTQEKPDDVRLIFVYYYQHTRWAAVKALKKVFSIKDYKQCLYSDTRGNDVLLFEHPCLIPHRTKNIQWFDDKYLRLLSLYLTENNIVLDAVIVHFPTRFSYFSSKINSKKRIMVVHYFDLAHKKNEFILKSSASGYDKIGCRSQNIYNKIEKIFPAEKAKFLCLSGIPDYLIKKSYAKKKWKPTGTLTISFVGTLIANKNPFQLLKSLQLLSNLPIEVNIIGDGRKKDEIKKYVKKHKLNNVHLIGKIEREMVFKYLCDSDLFVLTSHRETLGLVYLEAIAMGNLVIGSKGQGIDGIFDNSEGVFYVNPNSITDLTKCITMIYNLPQSLVYSMREKAYDKIRTFSDSHRSVEYFQNI